MKIWSNISNFFLDIKTVSFVLLVFYLLNLIFARIPGQLLKTYLNSEIGNSMALDKNPEVFDFPMITDFIRNHGSGISILIPIIVLGFFSYFLFHTLCLSAWISTLLHGKLNAADGFFSRGTGAFWRLLRLEIYAICIYLLIFGVANFAFISGGINPFELESDVALINRFMICNGLALLCICFIRLWHQMAKYFVVDSSSKLITGSIRDAFKFMKRHLMSVLGIQILFAVIIVLICTLAYYTLSSLELGNSTAHWIYIILTQVFIIALIYMKLIRYNAFAQLYQTDKNQTFE